ncbi:putative heat-labile enterotoxin [Ophiocordyceps camponoti-saundersi (nom. inval.)]|nr:putative heat-labile enterotoxin [Ophiocordyceps camponoti-saundersi (nom. inval.)]
MKSVFFVSILLAGAASQRPPIASGRVTWKDSEEENLDYTPSYTLPTMPNIDGILIVLEPLVHPQSPASPQPTAVQSSEEDEKSKTKKRKKHRRLGKHRKSKRLGRHRKSRRLGKHRKLKKLRKNGKQWKIRKQLAEAAKMLMEEASLEVKQSLPKMPAPEILLEADPEDDRIAKIVYRGDERPPWMLRALGGIPAEFEGPVVNASFSLEAHHLVDGRWRNFRSAYTTTARRFGSAALWAADPRVSDGWIYMIHATPNMINLTDSGFSLTYKAETEISALGGIRWDQIMAWTHVPMYDRPVVNPRDMCSLFLENPFLPKSWIANGEYNHGYDLYYSSEGQPQLGVEYNVDGDEDDVDEDDGDEDVGDEDDNGDEERQQRISLEQHALEFMRKNGRVVGWDEDSFPFLNLSAPTGPWPGPFPLNATEAAYIRGSQPLCIDPGSDSWKWP